MNPIDVTMVATRRPELFRETLLSFEKNLFRELRPPRLILNIDPMFGDEDCDARIEEIAHSVVGNVVIRRPPQPSFGAAVIWAWSQAETDWFLHLEDDWQLTAPPDLRRLQKQMQISRIAQIRLKKSGKDWRKGVWRPVVSTSPSFISREFARTVLPYMRPDLDPEKQFQGGHNPELAAAAAGFRYRVHVPRFLPGILVDTGRDWARARGIKKSVVDGRTIWSAD
jgi:hypothetical protein